MNKNYFQKSVSLYLVKTLYTKFVVLLVKKLKYCQTWLT